MSQEIDIVKLVCRKLDEADIHYMLTGSFASNFYATPRMTRDIDIVIELDELDINKFCQLFESDFYIDNQDSIKEAIEHQGMFNIIHNNSVFKIDFIIRKQQFYRTIEFKRRQQVDFYGQLIWIVAPEDLILSKLSWAKESLSEMQLNDANNLLKSMKNIDKEYLNQWIEQLQLSSIYEKAKIDA